MGKFIGRLLDIGISRESTRGTGVAPKFWLPKSNFTIEDKVTKARSALSYGNIGEGNQALVALKHAEGDIEADVLDKSFGLILYALFGTLSTSGSGPYTHTFSLQNDNQHDSLSITVSEPNQDVLFELAMIESLALNIVPDEVVKFTASFKSKSSADASATASYSAENKFIGRHLSFKIADTTGDLAAASAISLKSLTVNFNKNLVLDNVLGTVQPEDIMNRKFEISGELELNLQNDTYKDYMLNGSYKAVRIQLTNTDVTLSPSGNPTFTLDLSRVDFEGWEAVRPNDDIATQTFTFHALYDLTNGDVVNSCTLINEEDGTNYA